ncbi:MAG: histidine kinase [Lachnospiraceae bacterium]|nr:histidine kinase [Lachnospiraceae bacterium]
MVTKWNSASIQIKLTISFTFTLIIILAMNLFMYMNISSMMSRVDEVYISNLKLNELSEALRMLQESVRGYLDTKSSDALDSYYRADQEYRELLEGLNGQVENNAVKIAEKNIKAQSETYLEKVYETVQAKRGRNVERYKIYYDEAEKVYGDIQNCIYGLNNEQFRSNSGSYMILLSSLRYMEIVSTVILAVIGVINMIIVFMLTRNMTYPLIRLSKAANEVAAGNFNVEIQDVESEDEIGIVSKAFQKMVTSIQIYIQEIKNSMERESRMKEKELLMANSMREAQLMTLQAQINPHFLFNTLNAGAQLAMMEGADKTTEFIENMADFFRYNIKKMNQDTTVGEEVRLVDNYIYILNVRFTGEIHFEKEVDERVLAVKVPSMILQPIVENAVNYGIRNIGREGKIRLVIYQKEDFIYLSVWDNGAGMSEEKISQILRGELKEVDLKSNSNGIGLGNVIERLKLYTGREDVMEIKSAGKDQGTEFTIKVPVYR